MLLKISAPKSSLNKAYRDEPVGRNDIELFKAQLKQLFGKAAAEHSEDTLKDFVTEFLRNTYYKTAHIITVNKERKDFSIHGGKTTKDPVAVIAEVKKMAAAEMITEARPNVKAFHELVLYYLRERITFGNNAVKHLLATDVNNWLIIDVNEFDKKIYNNTKIKKLYELYISDKKDNPFFYGELRKILDETEVTFDATEFSFDKLKEIIKNADNADDDKLIPVYKILSPVHLLKLPFANDSNSLDKNFYTELLHIIGLEEIKDGGKKILRPKHTGSDASLLENTIIKLQDKECLRRVPELSRYGQTNAEQYLAIALELCITWVNRILFLKLLEAQLYSYHRRDNDYLFLNDAFIHDYDELSNLFFQVLAERPDTRRPRVQEKFVRVPYLNSSLFERTELEQHTIEIADLDNRLPLPLLAGTVLKDGTKRRTGSMPTLSYLMHFLNSYAFAGESRGGIQEESKTLINASVLGLIFEKINGYKDGSFFTPGFITMYMCRETLRRAVVQKFNEATGSAHTTFEDLQEHIEYSDKAKRQQANNIINSLTICDPAVGSGHFLVSALNELIAIKHDLKILQYRHSGLRIKEYSIEVLNDELRVRDAETEEPFEYLLNLKGNNKPELQQMQETLFHEKETLIENCLFGVDINANSVKICRLRLWIELLKNAYYTTASNSRELETLPNIDINIKQGNSLISRFAMDADLKPALQKSNFTIAVYRSAVQAYKQAQTKEEKRELETVIEKIKNDFQTHVGRDSKKYTDLTNLENKYFKLYEGKLFDVKVTAKEIKARGLMSLEIDTKKKELNEIKENVIYNDAFEWRFQFPEVLDNEGNYLGFDLVIGNPPYVFGGNEGISLFDKKYFKDFYVTGGGKVNLFTLFIEKSHSILKLHGNFSFIIPNTFLRVTSYHEPRKFFIENFNVFEIGDFGGNVFDEAITTAIVLMASKGPAKENSSIRITQQFEEINNISQKKIKEYKYVIATNNNKEKELILDKLKRNSKPLGIFCKELIFGIVITKNKESIVSSTHHEGWKPFIEGRDIGAYYIDPIHSFLEYDPQKIHRARTKAVFESPEKLLFQRITGGSKPLKVAYDNNQYYNKESINNLILKDDSPYNIKYILAILNSKLINWFYTSLFTNESKLTVNLSKEYLSQIPIIKISIEEQVPFIELANKVLLLKKKNSKADTTEFENEIDALVYKLYDLTEEEIEIIK